MADASVSGRLNALLIFVLLFGAVSFIRLYVLQVSGGERFREYAESQHHVSSDIVPDRGEIFFLEGGMPYPAAVNREYPMLYVSPREMEDVPAATEALSDMTGVPVDEIRAKCADRDDPFEIVKKKLTDDEVGRVRGLGIAGVHLLPEKYRYYPSGPLASQVVGFVSRTEGDVGDVGRYGIEAALDSELRGRSGRMEQWRDAAGRWISTGERSIDPAESGPDIVLTIDRVIQNEAERILTDAMETHGADAGSVIVLDPKTGRILAMASAPSFDPNAYSDVEDYARFMNPTISMEYEPGSIMKPVTMAIGLDTGQVEPDTEYVDTGSVVQAGYTIRNAEEKVYGRSTMTEVLEDSINTGVIYVEKRVGNGRFGKYLRDFGFGERTGVELPAELSGNIRNLDDDRRDLEHFTASFGQGVTATPLQMAMAYGALANSGVLMKPQIIERYVYEDGREEEVLPSEVRRVISEGASRQIGEMLESVVMNGHGKRAAVPGYRVGGKTGTAQVAKEGGGGYEEGISIGSFVGYAPVHDPRFVVLAKIDNPKDVIWAESSAAPMFGSMMRFLLSYAKIEPTEPIEVQETVTSEQKTEELEDVEADDNQEADRSL